MQTKCALQLARTWASCRAGGGLSVGHGIEAAIDLSDLGLKVAAVADAREDDQDPRLVERSASDMSPS